MTAWIVIGSIIAIVMGFCFKTGRGVTERVVIQQRLSTGNPLTWILIAIFAYLILKYIYLWKM